MDHNTNTEETRGIETQAAKAIELPSNVTRLLTREQAAYALGQSMRTFCRLIAGGDIEVVKIGRSLRITPRALNDFIAARESRINPRKRRKALAK